MSLLTDIGLAKLLTMTICNIIDKFLQNFHHMYRSLGGWTFEFEGYWLMNITRHIDDPNMQKMADIIDPLGKLR